MVFLNVKNIKFFRNKHGVSSYSFSKTLFLQRVYER